MPFPMLEVLESVRCLECGEIYAKPVARRHRAEEPRLPRLRLRRLDPDQPAAGAGSAAPLRRGSAAAPARSRRADAAEVVVPLRPAPHGEPARLEQLEPSSSTPGSAFATPPATCTRGRRRRPAARGPRRGSPAATVTSAVRRRVPPAAPIASSSRRVEDERRRHHALHPLARHERRRGGDRPRRACCSGAGRGPGASRPEPRPRLVVSTHALPSRRPRRGSSCASRGPPPPSSAATSATSAVGRGEAARAREPRDAPATPERPPRVRKRRPSPASRRARSSAARRRRGRPR